MTLEDGLTSPRSGHGRHGLRHGVTEIGGIVGELPYDMPSRIGYRIAYSEAARLAGMAPQIRSSISTGIRSDWVITL
jgi:hypothetical protein